MTMIQRNRFSERSPSFVWAGRAFAVVARHIRAKVRQRRHRKALIELRDMEDWQLRDIGITRSAVEDALFDRK